MLEDTIFYYDGINSGDMKVISANTSSGLFEKSFLPSRSIREESIRGRHKPYFLGYDLSSFTFPLKLVFDKINSEEKREISRWLLVDYYKRLYFQSNPDRIFYCMYEGDVEEFNNGLDQGYIELTMRCNSPFSYSPAYNTIVYDFSSNVAGGTEISFQNHGDAEVMPYIILEKIEDGDVSILNLSNNSQELKMTGIWNGDLINIDCENETIETEVAGVYRYDNHNNVFLQFPRGMNRLVVSGECKIQFKYQFITYQG